MLTDPLDLPPILINSFFEIFPFLWFSLDIQLNILHNRLLFILNKKKRGFVVHHMVAFVILVASYRKYLLYNSLFLVHSFFFLLYYSIELFLLTHYFNFLLLHTFLRNIFFSSFIQYFELYCLIFFSFVLIDIQIQFLNYTLLLYQYRFDSKRSIFVSKSHVRIRKMFDS